MYNSRDDRCLSFGTSSGMFRSNPPEGFYISSLMAQDVNLSMYASMNPNVDSSEQNLIIGQNFGVTRQYGKRKRDDSIIGGSAKSSTCNNYFSQPNANNNNVNTTKSTLSNTYNNGCSFARSYSAASNVRNTQATTGNLSIKQEFPPPIKYETLTKLRSKTPNEILAEMLDSNFQLQRFLNDNRMRTMYDWINSMTILLEKITQCIESRERIVMIFRQISKSQYLEGVYHEIRKPDLITNQLRFTFIQLFLKVSNTFLTMIPHSAGSLMKIFERIELLLTKVEIKSLVRQEYEETKTVLDEVLERLKEIENRRQPKKQKVNHNMGNNDNTPPLDDYRQLNIVPDIKEILSETTTYLRKNIIDGVYDNPHQYLDIHFRLLREDFLGPLHDGIDQYIYNVEGKNFNVRIYENVRSLGPRLNPRSGIVYDLYLDPKSASKIYWANSRRLMFGNLLVLTYNRFHSCIFATVEDRSNIEKNFIISVKPLENINRAQQIQIHLDDIDLSHVLTMIETTTYFEAYRPVLKALQSIDINQPFPFEPFLLKLTNANISPDYIRPETIYDFTPLLVDPDSHVDSTLIKPNLVSRLGRSRQDLLVQPMNNEFRITYKQSNQVPVKYKSVSLLDTNQWPTSDELHLNPKQREALILALTQKVALIQGPPGTGKTYLGVRIVEMLLYNRSVWCQSGLQSTPILMICHTNHALDQFLELIIKRLNINDGVIRVGGRSQNPIIQKFSLLDARRRVRENRLIPSHIYHQKHTILCKKTKAQEELKIHENEIEQSRTTIMPLSSLMDRYIIANEHLSSLLAPYYNRDKETILSDWLNIDPEYNSMAKSQINLMECAAPMPNMNEYEQERTTNNCQAPIDEENINEEEEEEQRRRGEIDIDDDEFMVYTKSKSESTKVKMSTINNNNDIDERQWYHAQRKPDSDRRSIKYIIQNPTTLNDQTVKRIRSDLWKLPMNERYDLYRYWLLKYQQCIFDWDRDKRRLYHQATAELAEEYQEEDYYILKDSVIVAMTTTCAAKCHAVLKKLQSKIVIVEEAAAIFEAHIITALSSKCEHLILIGDHIQLRPSASVYHLATRYNIDVSLFERLIKNKFPNVRLNIQHRMHSEIASLMKHFYDDLEDHISVKENRPSVRGVDSNIFFINHSHPETTVADGSSKRNEFEANYVIELAQYLRKQGYPAEKITILVMYLGQRQFIAKKAKSINLLRGVHITVTDNYQGEENDIIILSLVRSNTDNKIGFLKTHNRICVALSRARCGLFVIGNMNLLVQVEDLWKKIVQSLIDTNKIGTGLPLTCSQHPTHKLIANTPESFLNRAEGGCNKPCDSRLKCGHQCDLMCHNYDTEHRNIICHKKCQESLPCGHACTKQCHVATTNQHNSCRILVNKTIASCGHNIHFECARTPTNDDCKQLVMALLPCDHTANIPCRIASSPSQLKRFRCWNPCNTILDCEHQCAGTCDTCHSGRLHMRCQQKCERSLICSHVCKEPCAVNCPPCERECETRCIHSRCKKRCGEPCAYKCKHLKCTRLCSEPCNRDPCNEPCDKKLKCGHTCIGFCCEPCPRECRICDKRIVQEILFGTEDEPDARFVFLPDCKHIIEVTALDKYVNDSFNNSQNDTAIRFPECPRCKQSIRRCMRYMPILNRVHSLIAQVKKKILGNKTEKELNEQRILLIKDFEKTENNLKEINLRENKNFFNRLYDSNIFLYDEILIRMKNILTFLNEIDKLLIDGRKALPKTVFANLLSLPLHHIIKYLFSKPQNRNFAEQQIKDIEAELIRFRRVIYYEALLKFINENSKCTLKSDEQNLLDSLKHLTKKAGRFTDIDKENFDSLIKTLEHLYNLPGLGITENERVAIVAALNLKKGHWYVCPKGHPYVITECGGANQESLCPECREKIGGQKHQLLPTNRHFDLMDNSQYAAWSDEANLNFIPQNI
ncbi:unnamed protein product [Rotaria sp. Silwood2]|nr:unnamed protein product [Rotaria sp. Silwood2]